MAGALCLLSCRAGQKGQGSEPARPNILLIAVDDLRPELHCYGAGHIVSPNIDRLASEGVLFTRAYTQQAVCAPSRNTLLTGIRPDGLGIHDLGTFFREKAPGVVTLPQHYRLNGYASEGMGKVYHTGHGNRDDTLSWSRGSWTPAGIVGLRQPINSGDTTRLETCYPMVGERRISTLRSLMPEEMHDEALIASHAIERMRELKDTAFFLAVGFRKPHLPFVAPARYWDLYDHASIAVPPKERPDAPPYAFANSGELRNYHGMPAEGFVDDGTARELIHGYYACVSFIDAQVGRLVDELKRLGLYDQTIIVIWGDHGWKLGDYGEWCKHTNYEIDTRIPVIVRLPGEGTPRGWQSDALIETVDIYPTLCELAGLPLPAHLQGSSFMAALEQPGFQWEDVAFSQYPRTWRRGEEQVQVMGTSMRTDVYRLTRWVDRETGELLSTELYDHTGDAPELENLAEDPQSGDVRRRLEERFDEEYRKEHRTQ